jgi:putative endonuclease
MVFHTYILRSLSTGRFYIGHTANLVNRVARHNANRSPSLKNRGPWELVHSEEFSTRAQAARRERQIKRKKSHQWIEQVVRASR